MAQMRSAFALDAIKASVSRFRSDERGAMAFFMLFLLLIMLMIGGIAVDVMRFETRRVAMQQTMDRAVLAAANLTQKRTPTAIATDWFAKASLGTGLDMVSFGTPVISEVADVGLRRVTISSEVRSYNFFMDLLNVDYLEGPTNTQATQGVSNIEVILALDITGSMKDPASSGSTKRKIDALKESATEFIDIVKGQDSRGTVSIGIVPYASQVNMPAALRAKFNATKVSSWNGVANAGVPNIDCIEIPASTYTSTGLSTALAMPMASIADFRASSNTTVALKPSDYPVKSVFGNSVCGATPDDTATTGVDESLDPTRNHIMLPTMDEDDLKAKIASLAHGGNTSIAIGMRWASALIDESARPIYTALADSSVAGRPADNAGSSGTEDTRKIIVLMTDGEHVKNDYIVDAYKAGLSPIYRGADGNFAIRFSTTSTTPLNTGVRPGGSATNTCSGWVLSNYANREFFLPHMKRNSVKKKNLANEPEGQGTGTAVTAACDPQSWVAGPTWTNSGTVTQLDWSEVWRYLRVDYVARQLYVRSGVPGATNATTVLDTFRTTYISVSTLNTLLQQNCTAAKDAGIEIYGIAFAAPTNGQTQISNCSSSPKETYYFSATDNAKLTAAFKRIATDISALRLTQ